MPAISVPTNEPHVVASLGACTAPKWSEDRWPMITIPLGHDQQTARDHVAKMSSILATTLMGTASARDQALLIRKILFFDGIPNRLGRYIHSLPDRAMILGIRNHFSLDAFLALLCLARKGELLEQDPQHFLPASRAFDIFPRVLAKYPPLAYRWEDLFHCLNRIYWQRVYGDGMYYTMDIATVSAGLQMLRTDPGSTLQMMSGKRIRMIGEDPLSDVERRYRSSSVRVVFRYGGIHLLTLLILSFHDDVNGHAIRCWLAGRFDSHPSGGAVAHSLQIVGCICRD
jgi:hypothetical protein